MAAAAMAAFVAAPLFEETGFRLVFQGWLERCEARYRQPTAPIVTVSVDGEAPDDGELAAARAMEAYLLMWLRLYEATGTPMVNTKVVR